MLELGAYISKSKGCESVHNGFHITIMGHDMNTGMAFKERKKLAVYFTERINSSITATMNRIEWFQIRRPPVSL